MCNYLSSLESIQTLSSLLLLVVPVIQWTADWQTGGNNNNDEENGAIIIIHKYIQILDIKIIYYCRSGYFENICTFNVTNVQLACTNNLISRIHCSQN